MGQTNSNPVRLYTRFIRILKIIRYLGFFVVALLGLYAGALFLQRDLGPLALVFLLQASIGAGMIYFVTQALIAIVDLLSRIEQNTRSQWADGLLVQGKVSHTTFFPGRGLKRQPGFGIKDSLPRN